LVQDHHKGSVAGNKRNQPNVGGRKTYQKIKIVCIMNFEKFELFVKGYTPPPL